MPAGRSASNFPMARDDETIPTTLSLAPVALATSGMMGSTTPSANPNMSEGLESKYGVKCGIVMDLD